MLASSIAAAQASGARILLPGKQQRRLRAWNDAKSIRRHGLRMVCSFWTRSAPGGDMAATSQFRVTRLSDDGGVVVGAAPDVANGLEVWGYWKRGSGWKLLKTALADAGLNGGANPVTILTIKDVTPDGKTIVGEARPSGAGCAAVPYIAYLP